MDNATIADMGSELSRLEAQLERTAERLGSGRRFSAVIDALDMIEAAR